MAQEATKSGRRFIPYLKGTGIDIGCGNDPILPDAFCWDKEQGDAQLLESALDASYDYVFSSHCLEHMRNPLQALLNWWRVLKVGGYLVILVPDEDLYEQRVWPSVFNDDHKNTYTLSKDRTWSNVSINLMELIRYLPDHRLIEAKIYDTNYDYDQVGVTDQTLFPDREASVTMVLQKYPAPLPGLTSLKQSIVCPTCGGEVIVRGQTHTPGEWQIRCAKCNMVGKMTL